MPRRADGASLLRPGRRAGAGVAALVLLLPVTTACSHGTAAEQGATLPVLRLDPEAVAPGHHGAPIDVDPPDFYGPAGWVLPTTLPPDRAHAAVHEYRPSAADVATVTRLAAALGVTGVPQRRAHGWRASSTRGEVLVHDGGGNAWAFARADTVSCPDISIDVDSDSPFGAPPCLHPVAGTAEASGAAAAARPASTRGVAPASVPQLRALARPVLEAAGLSPADISRAKAEVADGWGRLVVAPTVAGLPTVGIDTLISTDAHGIAAAGGRLTTPARGPEYPLVSARTAFAALVERGRAAASGDARARLPGCGPDPDDNPFPSGEPPWCQSPTPAPLSDIALGLVLDHDASGTGREVLVPAWLFTEADSETVDVFAAPLPITAVDPRFVAAVPPGPWPDEPADEPATTSTADPGGLTSPDS